MLPISLCSTDSIQHHHKCLHGTAVVNGKNIVGKPNRTTISLHDGSAYFIEAKAVGSTTLEVFLSHRYLRCTMTVNINVQQGITNR